MERKKIYRFGAKLGKPFTLTIRAEGDGRRLYRLDRDGKTIKVPSKPQVLQLLHLMLQNSKQELSREKILNVISPRAEDNLVDRLITILRHALGDNAKKPKFIDTARGLGYMFMLDIEFEDGDLGAVEAFDVWDKARFYELMNRVKRGDPKESTEDLRIVTTGLDEVDVEALLVRGLRLKILFMNGANAALLHARYSLRSDKIPPEGVNELKAQIVELERLAAEYRVGGPQRGTLEFHLSDIMPCGIVVHSRDWAILGIFLAHQTYMRGPMLQINSDSVAWEQLRLDWAKRWEEAQKKSPMTIRLP